MRSARLARIAAEAEGVRLRGFASRIVTRALLGLIALLFVFGALVFAHIAAWNWLLVGLDRSRLAAACILSGADLLVAVILAFLATRSSPSQVEIEALDVRRKAVQAIGGTLSLTRLVIPIMRIMVNRRRRRQD